MYTYESIDDRRNQARSVNRCVLCLLQLGWGQLTTKRKGVLAMLCRAHRSNAARATANWSHDIRRGTARTQRFTCKRCFWNVLGEHVTTKKSTSSSTIGFCACTVCTRYANACMKKMKKGMSVAKSRSHFSADPAHWETSSATSSISSCKKRLWRSLKN